ncbi:MAG: histidinol-phosphate transaminase [Oscillospiraceae bacterium]|nr:histidinol-phosphate transaminase [Oscillospiraceae bacterium]
MSRFFSEKYKDLNPYVPGEQPRDRRYIKLNTNESPFPPSPKAVEYAAAAARNLQLYSDPTCTSIKEKMAQLKGVKKEQLFFGNGSDEVLYCAFLAFCDNNVGAIFPDISYGFYKVFAQFTGIPHTQVPLEEDFSIAVEPYCGAGKTVFIANPNAPTGKLLSIMQIETILKANPDNVVVIDEAYIDFGGESAIRLIDSYDNLLVTQTFSKSRSLAGGRLGMAFGNEKLIQDLLTVKYSINPYNVNSMTMAAGLGALEDEEYTQKNCKTVAQNRAFTTENLRKLNFTVLDSSANFAMAAHPDIPGGTLYQKLKDKGILVRYFGTERLAPYVRITIGSREQMESLLQAVTEILEERP